MPGCAFVMPCCSPPRGASTDTPFHVYVHKAYFYQVLGVLCLPMARPPPAMCLRDESWESLQQERAELRWWVRTHATANRKLRRQQRQCGVQETMHERQVTLVLFCMSNYDVECPATWLAKRRGHRGGARADWGALCNDIEAWFLAATLEEVTADVPPVLPSHKHAVSVARLFFSKSGVLQNGFSTPTST